jgi:hypothetical protein
MAQAEDKHGDTMEYSMAAKKLAARLKTNYMALTVEHISSKKFVGNSSSSEKNFSDYQAINTIIVELDEESNSTLRTTKQNNELQ